VSKFLDTSAKSFFPCRQYWSTIDRADREHAYITVTVADHYKCKARIADTDSLVRYKDNDCTWRRCIRRQSNTGTVEIQSECRQDVVS